MGEKMTPPRNYPIGFRGTEKARRHASEQAERDRSPMALVEFEGKVIIRPLVRAQRMLLKHRNARITDTFYPRPM